MTVEFDPPDMRALSKRLKAAGKNDLAKELNKQINATVKPLRQAFKASAMRKLPGRGGLNRRVARTRYRTQKNQNGIRLIATNQYDLDKLDQEGFIRHPTFGGKPWVRQDVPKGTFTEPFEAHSSEVGKGVSKAIEDTIKKIDGDY